MSELFQKISTRYYDKYYCLQINSFSIARHHIIYIFLFIIKAENLSINKEVYKNIKKSFSRFFLRKIKMDIFCPLLKFEFIN